MSLHHELQHKRACRKPTVAAQCDILRQTSGEARDELTEAYAFPGHRGEQTWHSEYDMSLRKDSVMR